MESPGQKVVIDESMVPFGGDFYSNNTSQRKLTVTNMGLSCSKSEITLDTHMGWLFIWAKLQVQLMTCIWQHQLSSSWWWVIWTIVAFYTSINFTHPWVLANTLLNQSTHLVGTITSKRAQLPHQTIVNEGGKHLRKGEMKLTVPMLIFSIL